MHVIDKDADVIVELNEEEEEEEEEEEGVVEEPQVAREQTVSFDTTETECSEDTTTHDDTVWKKRERKMGSRPEAGANRRNTNDPTGGQGQDSDLLQLKDDNTAVNNDDRNPDTSSEGRGRLVATNPNKNKKSGIEEGSEDSNSATHAPESVFSCGPCSRETIGKGSFFFQWHNLVLAIAVLALYYVDIVTDISLAGLYFQAGQSFNGGVTLAIVSFSYFCSGLLFLGVWVTCMAHLPPLPRYGAGILWSITGPVSLPAFFVWVHVYYGCKSRSRGLSPRKREIFVGTMTKGAGGNVLCRLVQVFLGSAVQLVWQMYLLLVSQPPLRGSVEVLPWTFVGFLFNQITTGVLCGRSPC